MEAEGMDELEQQLLQALERLPAPPGLKRRVIERREAQHAARRRRQLMWWRRMAVAAAAVCLLAAVWFWRGAEQRREGEEARGQVILALRITNRALTQMRSQLAAHNQAIPGHRLNEPE